MSARRLVAAGVLRRRPCGSALPEPSPVEVYEGRLPATHPVSATPVVGRNFLDLTEAASARALEPVVQVPVQGWVPWCDECWLEPLAAHTQGGAEYLARQHDIAHHSGMWTAEARRAAEAADLLADRMAGRMAGPVGGVR